MLRVNRVELLRALQTVHPGLSSGKAESIEQSSCFVFRDGEVITYNDEIACRMATPLDPEFTGAVPGKPLLTILSKLVEDEVDIAIENGELLIKGKRRSTGLRMEQEILLPIDTAEVPGDDWQSLHEDFSEAIRIVQECAGKDASRFTLTCVHVHPKWVEAFDNYHMARYKLRTGVKEPCLIRKDSLRHIVSLEMNEFTETDAWIHFRNTAGLTLSCRRFVEEYKDLSPILKVSGRKMQLPKGLSDAADRADVFSSENADNNQVRVDLKGDKLRIKGVGSSGWYSEIKKIQYDGPPLSFQISPELLKTITRRHNECEISQKLLKVDGGKWCYVTSLGAVAGEAPAVEVVESEA